MEQVKSFVKRLHVPGAVEEKALEYCRLAEVKCSSASRGAISPSCLAVVCIDLACVQLGEPFDKVPLSLSLSLSLSFSLSLSHTHSPPQTHTSSLSTNYTVTICTRSCRKHVNVCLVCHPKATSPSTRLWRNYSMFRVKSLSETLLFVLAV